MSDPLAEDLTNSPGPGLLADPNRKFAPTPRLQNKPAQQTPVQQSAQAAEPSGLPPGAVIQPIGTANQSSQQSSQPEEQPIGLPPGAVVQPIGTAEKQAAQPVQEDKGVLASLKRNNPVSVVQGIYHAINDPVTEEEKEALLKKVREQNKKAKSEKDLISEDLAKNPSKATMAFHRILDAPADVLSEKGHDEIEAAQDLLKNHQYWKGGNMYLSGLTDKLLSAVPIAGPYIGSIAERAESGDISGAATDVASALALEHAPAIVKGVSKGAGRAVEAVGDTASATKRVTITKPLQSILKTAPEELHSVVRDLAGKTEVEANIKEAGSHLPTFSEHINNIHDDLTDIAKDPLNRTGNNRVTEFINRLDNKGDELWDQHKAIIHDAIEGVHPDIASIDASTVKKNLLSRIGEAERRANPGAAKLAEKWINQSFEGDRIPLSVADDMVRRFNAEAGAADPRWGNLGKEIRKAASGEVRAARDASVESILNKKLANSGLSPEAIQKINDMKASLKNIDSRWGSLREIRDEIGTQTNKGKFNDPKQISVAGRAAKGAAGGAVVGGVAVPSVGGVPGAIVGGVGGATEAMIENARARNSAFGSRLDRALTRMRESAGSSEPLTGSVLSEKGSKPVIQRNLLVPPEAPFPVGTQGSLLNDPSTLFDINQTSLSDLASNRDKGIVRAGLQKPFQDILDSPDATTQQKAFAQGELEKIRDNPVPKKLDKPQPAEGPKAPSRSDLEKAADMLKKKELPYRHIIDSPDYSAVQKSQAHSELSKLHKEFGKMEAEVAKGEEEAAQESPKAEPVANPALADRPADEVFIRQEEPGKQMGRLTEEQYQQMLEDEKSKQNSSQDPVATIKSESPIKDTGSLRQNALPEPTAEIQKAIEGTKLEFLGSDQMGLSHFHNPETNDTYSIPTEKVNKQALLDKIEKKRLDRSGSSGVQSVLTAGLGITGATLLADELSGKDKTDPVKEVLDQYKGLKSNFKDGDVVVVYPSKERLEQLKKVGQQDNQLEYWSPEETGAPDFPRPEGFKGKHIIEVYSDKLINNPKKLKGAIYGDLLHGLDKDSYFSKLKKEFTQNYPQKIKEENEQMIKDGEHSRKELDDMFIRGRLAKDQGEEWVQKDRYSKKQLDILYKMRQYLKTGIKLK